MLSYKQVMSDKEDFCSIFCCLLGILLLSKNFQQNEDLATKLGILGPKICKNMKKFYLMGQSVVTDDVDEIAKILLIRDYPKIAQFNGESGAMGPIFVPEGYLPKKPRIINTEIPMEISKWISYY